MEHKLTIIVLYHAQCTDGAGSMWSAWKHFGNSATYIPVGKSSKKQKSLLSKCVTASQLYMCDVMLDEEDIITILDNNVKVYFLDHHITNIQNIFGRRAYGSYDPRRIPCMFTYDWKTEKCVFDQPDSRGVVDGCIPFADINRTYSELYWRFPNQVFELNDLNRSGAGISWDYFNNSPRPILIDLIEKFDLGKWVDSSEEIHCFLGQFNWNKPEYIIEIFEKLYTLTFEELKELGKPILDYKHNLIKKSLAQVGRATIDVGGVLYDVPSLNTDHFVSEISYHMYQNEAFSFVWRIQSDGSVRVSLRSSNNGKDVSVIASLLGKKGGGHIRASGTTFDSLEDMLKVVKFHG